MKLWQKTSMTGVLVICFVGAFWLVGWAGEGAPENSHCDADITWEVIKEVELTQTCQLETNRLFLFKIW